MLPEAGCVVSAEAGRPAASRGQLAAGHGRGGRPARPAAGGLWPSEIGVPATGSGPFGLGGPEEAAGLLRGPESRSANAATRVPLVVDEPRPDRLGGGTRESTRRFG